MSLSIANISGNFFGKVPAGYGPFPNPTGRPCGFFFHILPFIEQDDVYKNLAFNTPIKTYHAPTDVTNPGKTPANSYAVNGRAIGGYCPNGPVATFPGFFSLKGTSNTVTIVERYARLNGHWWGCEADNADGSCILYGPHTDFRGAVKDPSFGLPPSDPNCSQTANGYSGTGMQVALADGSYRIVAPIVTSCPNPAMGTSIWGWAVSIGGPAGAAPPPAEW
jgi:hypothetical protein